MGLIFWGGLHDENLVFVGCGVGVVVVVILFLTNLLCKLMCHSK